MPTKTKTEFINKWLPSPTQTMLEVCSQEELNQLEAESTCEMQEDLESVITSGIEARMPSEEEIDEQIDKYAFRVPYDGSNEFYDKIALKHYQAGINWLKNKLT